MIEVSVILKDAERRYKQDFLIYEKFVLDVTDPTVQNCINEALKCFPGQPESVVVKAEIEA